MLIVLGCGGNGGQTQTCNSCGGRGWTERMVGNAFFRQVQKEQCNMMYKVRGSIVIKACTIPVMVLDTIKNEEIINFSVPIDLQPGQSIRLQQQGGRNT